MLGLCRVSRIFDQSGRIERKKCLKGSNLTAYKLHLPLSQKKTLFPNNLLFLYTPDVTFTAFPLSGKNNLNRAQWASTNLLPLYKTFFLKFQTICSTLFLFHTYKSNFLTLAEKKGGNPLELFTPRKMPRTKAIISDYKEFLQIIRPTAAACIQLAYIQQN